MDLLVKFRYPKNDPKYPYNTEFVTDFAKKAFFRTLCQKNQV